MVLVVPRGIEEITGDSSRSIFSLLEWKVCYQTNQGQFQSCGCRPGFGTNNQQSAKKCIRYHWYIQKEKNFVVQWELDHHEMLAITKLHRELAGIGCSSNELEVNRTFSKAGAEFEESNVQTILNVIERNENPFQIPPKEKRLHNIMTKEVVPMM